MVVILVKHKHPTIKTNSSLLHYKQL